MENLLRLLIRTIICNLMIDESPEKKNKLMTKNINAICFSLTKIVTKNLCFFKFNLNNTELLKRFK